MIYVNSFAYSSVKVWNSILPDVRNCNSLSSFKAGYLKGIVHLNIKFSYMKFNKICNLDHPVY